MRIDETKIFEFSFDFYGGHFSIPVRAQTREEAAQALKKILDGFMIELATEFPQVVSGTAATPDPRAQQKPVPETHDTAGSTAAPAVSGAPTYALELSIEDLVKSLVPIKKPIGAQPVDRLVKEWTGFDYIPQNYAAIIDDLKAQLEPGREGKSNKKR